MAVTCTCTEFSGTCKQFMDILKLTKHMFFQIMVVLFGWNVDIGFWSWGKWFLYFS